MSASTLLRRGAAVLAALSLGACGGSLHADRSGGRGQVDDPRSNSPNHVKCLQAHGLPVTRVGSTGLQIGTSPSGPTVQFTPSPGVAQGEQIQAKEQGAEVIGPALLYPNGASDEELKKIEDCLSQGVKG